MEKVTTAKSSPPPVKNITNPAPKKVAKPISTLSKIEQKQYVVAGIPLQDTPKDPERFIEERRTLMSAARPKHKEL